MEYSERVSSIGINDWNDSIVKVYQLIKEQMEQSKIYQLFAYSHELKPLNEIMSLKDETVNTEFIILALRFIKLLMRLAKYKDFPEQIDRVVCISFVQPFPAHY